MSFRLSEAIATDNSEMATIYMAALEKDDIWAPLIGQMTKGDQYEWLCRYFESRNSSPDKRVWVIREEGSSKMVAFAGMTIPYVFSEEEKAASAGRSAFANPPKGHNEELAGEFFGTLGAAEIYGYDPEKHFNRRGTMVHPDYQQNGLGRKLTVHLNEVADKEGAKTFCCVRPNSKKLFLNNGFKILGPDNIDMTRYGGSEEDGKGWIMAREVNGV